MSDLLPSWLGTLRCVSSTKICFNRHLLINTQLITAAAEFDVAALRANILDSQQNGQTWRDFTLRAMNGGVQGYFAFLRGQRVTCFCHQGDQHTEWFPGAKPTSTATM